MTKDYINRVYLDKFKVEEEIPGPEYELTFIGRDIESDKKVSIRVIPIDPAHPELIEQTQNFVFKEVSLLQRLNFPGLPVFLESQSGKDDNVIITEYVNAEPLSKLLESKNILSEDEAINILEKLLPMLNYLHTQTPPVIYRDLQPKSILVDDAGAVFLTKYELARTYKVDKVKDTQVHSTRGYSPPEQAFGKGQSDARSDLFAVGMIIYQMLTGKDPTKAPLILPRISDLRSDVSSVWTTVVSKATNIKVDRRYPSVREMIKEIQKIKETFCKEILIEEKHPEEIVVVKADLIKPEASASEKAETSRHSEREKEKKPEKPQSQSPKEEKKKGETIEKQKQAQAKASQQTKGKASPVDLKEEKQPDIEIKSAETTIIKPPESSFEKRQVETNKIPEQQKAEASVEEQKASLPPQGEVNILACLMLLVDLILLGLLIIFGKDNPYFYHILGVCAVGLIIAIVLFFSKSKDENLKPPEKGS